MPKPIRIQKLRSDHGILSRRKTEEYIRAGRITVNGRPADPGHPVTPADVIAIDGQRVRLQEKKELLYLMLHKPRGYVTTTSDELGRRCVTQLVEGLDTRVYPVGRLDRDSEGLLLMTNDGDFAQRLAHPSHGLEKEYRVTVSGRLEGCRERLAALSALEDGTPIAPARVAVLARRGGRWVLSVVICQGLNRQVRRMCALAGLEVARLVRVREGPLELGSLPGGRWRRLTEEELAAVYRSGGKKTPE